MTGCSQGARKIYRSTSAIFLPARSGCRWYSRNAPVKAHSSSACRSPTFPPAVHSGPIGDCQDCRISSVRRSAGAGNMFLSRAQSAHTIPPLAGEKPCGPFFSPAFREFPHSVQESSAGAKPARHAAWNSNHGMKQRPGVSSSRKTRHRFRNANIAGAGAPGGKSVEVRSHKYDAHKTAFQFPRSPWRVSTGMHSRAI